MLNHDNKQTLMSISTMALISFSAYIFMDAFSLSSITSSGSSKQTIHQSKVLAYQVAAMYQQGLISSKFDQGNEQNLSLRGPASINTSPEIAGKISKDSWGRDFTYRIEPGESGEFKVIITSEGNPEVNAPIQTEVSFYKE